MTAEDLILKMIKIATTLKALDFQDHLAFRLNWNDLQTLTKEMEGPGGPPSQFVTTSQGGVITVFYGIPIVVNDDAEDTVMLEQDVPERTTCDLCGAELKLIYKGEGRFHKEILSKGDSNAND